MISGVADGTVAARSVSKDDLVRFVEVVALGAVVAKAELVVLLAVVH